jgi:hypothetical protein
LTEDFYSVNILSQEAPKKQEVKEEGHEAQKSTGGRTTHTRLGLVPPMSFVFISNCLG